MRLNAVLRKHPRVFLTLRLLAASAAAILLADVLRLQFSISAGIVAILSVAPTRRETIRTACDRLLAFAAALMLAWGCYTLIGYSNAAFLVYLALFLPLCQLAGWSGAMAMDSVLISHFLTLGRMDGPALLNEAGIFALGAGCGIAVNLLLRPDADYAEQLKTSADELIRTTLRRMAERILQQHDGSYDGSCITRLYQAVDAARDAARNDLMNRLGQTDLADLQYIAMRRRQVDLLQEMYHRVRDLKIVPDTAQPVADLLLRVSREYAQENTARELLDALAALETEMKQRPLPETRDDFEARAELYAFLQSLKHFLMIKQRYAAGEE